MGYNPGLYPQGYWSYWHRVIGVTGYRVERSYPRGVWGYTLGVNNPVTPITLHQ